VGAPGVAGQSIAISALQPAISTAVPNILLVEDNSSLRGLAAEVLRGSGYDVVECDSSEAALEYARAQSRIDLLVSDVALRGMTGIDLAHVIAGSRPYMAVLFISGYPDESVTEDRAGARSRFLQKPFGAGSLISNVRALLEA
jgi:two-component system cell cycle sensor histidine kinase/response regulator CckA